jgi:hypothetical protein
VKPVDPLRKERKAATPGGGKRKNRDSRRDARREAAEKRQAEYAFLTDDEKLARVSQRTGYTVDEVKAGKKIVCNEARKIAAKNNKEKA